jgi:hypothetical protein
MVALAAAASKIQKTWRGNKLRDRFRTMVLTTITRFCTHFDDGSEVDRGAVDAGRSQRALQNISSHYYLWNSAHEDAAQELRGKRVSCTAPGRRRDVSPLLVEAARVLSLMICFSRYTPAALKARFGLLIDPDIQSRLGEFWTRALREFANDNTREFNSLRGVSTTACTSYVLEKSGYKTMHERMVEYVNAEHNDNCQIDDEQARTRNPHTLHVDCPSPQYPVCDNPHQAAFAFEKDWELDSQGCAHLGKQKFFTAIFEFIDHCGATS